MMVRLRLVVWVALLVAFASSPALAQTTGSITGSAADTSGGVLPGVTISLSGERLIGGIQTRVTDELGRYRFDRLPPGTYAIKAELAGFKTVHRDAIRISAAFVATINVSMAVGELSETLTVTGESPTVDTKSNVQQTIMGQDVLEVVPTGRDPWSLAKIIPGIQISTYDVGGTQSMQQSAIQSHGSNTADVSYNVDGANVNWPGGSGGATMLYYDQGMFEEVNYTTSAIPAETMVGGVSINMVTKEAGNRWRGTLRYAFANDKTQADNWSNVPALTRWAFIGNPTQELYDVNLTGGGALIRDRLWLTGATRFWRVDRLTAAKNADGSRATDENRLKNYSGKLAWQATSNNKLSASYNYNNKIRDHRRDTPPDFVPNIASWVQNNPGYIAQVKYLGIRQRLVYESSFSAMIGETDYYYQPDTPPDAVRVVDTVLSTANFAAPYEEILPNSRIQWDNSFAYSRTGWGGEHVFKGGVQWSRLRLLDQYRIQGDKYLIYNNGVPAQVQIWNTPASGDNVVKMLGFFAQDAWTIARKLTLNVGARFDTLKGYIPEQSSAAGTYVPARSMPRTDVVDQQILTWRAGLVYDPAGDGKTAFKANYSRYPLQVGVDRVQLVNPFFLGSATCPWSDLNGNGKAEANEVGTCSGFPVLSRRYADADGPDWSFSDEITFGVERQVAGALRVGLMYYHRTNRNLVGTRNLAVPSSAYTPVTVTVPGSPTGPGGSATFYNLNPSYLGLQNNVLDNEPFLDTTYDGIELTVNKRMSNRWQMTAGVTAGRNRGGTNSPNSAQGWSATVDLNDPNFTLGREKGIVGYDSKVSFRLSGSYRMWRDLMLSGSLISNGGFPYVSTYTVNRTIYPALTRSTQAAFLSSRGDERLPTVTMVDLRLSKAFKFGSDRQFVPQVDLFNITNASTTAALNQSVGSSYLRPTQILSPRILRFGFSLDF